MGADVLNVFGTSKLRRAASLKTEPAQFSVYNEEPFRHLLLTELKRSQRSGHSFQVLLVYREDKEGVVASMDSYGAAVVLNGLWRCIRETDYIGWYRQGHVLGGVLTVVGRESVADVNDRVQSRLWQTLHAELSAEECRCIRIRVCQPHEIEGIIVRGGSAFIAN